MFELILIQNYFKPLLIYILSYFIRLVKCLFELCLNYVWVSALAQGTKHLMGGVVVTPPSKTTLNFERPWGRSVWLVQAFSLHSPTALIQSVYRRGWVYHMLVILVKHKVATLPAMPCLTSHSHMIFHWYHWATLGRSVELLHPPTTIRDTSSLTLIKHSFFKTLIFY